VRVIASKQSGLAKATSCLRASAAVARAFDGRTCARSIPASDRFDRVGVLACPA